MRTESYEVLPYFIQQCKHYTINSAYHNVVVEEGWAGHEDGAQKTGILSAEFLAVKLSLHDDPRQPIAPNFR